MDVIVRRCVFNVSLNFVVDKCCHLYIYCPSIFSEFLVNEDWLGLVLELRYDDNRMPLTII